jgi:STE24 endopeptidase
LAALLVFWFAGGFQHLDAWLRGFGYGPIVTGVLFIGILVLAKGLLDLPFSVYSTFVVEERFGFNRTTPRTFALDLVKGLLLSVALGAPILALVLFFFERAGDAAWLYCWLATTAFTLFFLFVFPTWIMPLFNKFEPLEEGELRDALFAYARSVDFGLGGIFVVDGSRRSSKANAFFTGFGRNKRIALFDTLVEKHPARELVAVLAHEVGHYKLGHVFKNLAISVAHSGVLFFLLSIFLGHRGLYDAFFMAHTSVYAGLVFFGLLYAPIELILSLLLNLQLRSHEYQADRFAAETTGEPEAMVSALRRIAADSLSNLTPHPFYVFLNASHPPLLQRVRAIRAAAA